MLSARTNICETQVRNPQMEWPYPAIVTHRRSHAIRTEQHHYIRYEDGSEELYDIAADPELWNNLASDRSTRIQ